jgi:hypothetical protein
MTPYEMEQAVYNGVRRALTDMWIGFMAFFIFWAVYQYGGTVLSYIGAALLWLLNCASRGQC